MVMNKKGFLKILESIVAILIVLGFVVAIIPNKPVAPSKLPPDLEQTTNSILKEVQETPEFRGCVLGEETRYFSGSSGAECVYEYIQFITRPKQLHPWNYGVRKCKLEEGIAPSCEYYDENGENNEDLGIIAEQIGKNVYIKTVTISVKDVLGEDVVGEALEGEAGITYLLTIFAWSKS